MESMAFIKGLEKVTDRWCKQRKREEREASAGANRRYVLTRRRHSSIKAAAWKVMESAYLKASANGTLPAHARQVMYAARGEILRLTDRDRLSDQYFTQTVLPEYVRDHPEAESWDIVYDARGHFFEPHTEEQIGIGTLEVRQYLLDAAGEHKVTPEEFILGMDEDKNRWPTKGPRHRYQGILFVD